MTFLLPLDKDGIGIQAGSSTSMSHLFTPTPPDVKRKLPKSGIQSLGEVQYRPSINNFQIDNR